eukprot:3930519-Rhodomonas_salina.1
MPAVRVSNLPPLCRCDGRAVVSLSMRRSCSGAEDTLGLGLAAVGRPGYINLGVTDLRHVGRRRDAHVGDSSTRTVDVMKRQSHDVMDAAWDSGIRYFDAARSYGKAEEFLSSWLESKNIAPEQVAVGRYTADWRVDTGGEPHEVKDHSCEHFLKQRSAPSTRTASPAIIPGSTRTAAQESVESLGLLESHLRLYQIHSATLESGVLSDPKVLDQLRAFKSDKRVRLGLSLSGVKQADTLRVALAVPLTAGADPSSGRLFDCVQATWNLLEQSAGEALEEARQAGMDVIIKEVPYCVTHSLCGVRLRPCYAICGTDFGYGAIRPVGAKVAATAEMLGCSGDALCLVCPDQPMRSLCDVRVAISVYALSMRCPLQTELSAYALAPRWPVLIWRTGLPGCSDGPAVPAYGILCYQPTRVLCDARLRACYAMSGTDTRCGATCLRSCYTMPDTGIMIAAHQSACLMLCTTPLKPNARTGTAKCIENALLSDVAVGAGAFKRRRHRAGEEAGGGRGCRGGGCRRDAQEGAAGRGCRLLGRALGAEMELMA